MYCFTYMKLLTEFFFIEVLWIWPIQHLPPCFRCILVLSLSAPPLSTMKLLPSSSFKRAFPSVWAELHPVCTGKFLLTYYSRKLTENVGICLNLRALFPEWGRLQRMLALVPAVYGKFPLPLKGQFGCPQSNSWMSRGSSSWPCGLSHISVFCAAVIGVAS